MVKITKAAHKGVKAIYLGFDGVSYRAKIADVHKGVAVIDYRLGNGQMVRAYVDRPFHYRLLPTVG